MGRKPDSAALVSNSSGDCLTDPPRGVGGKLVPMLVVEFVNRLHQSDLRAAAECVPLSALRFESISELFDERAPSPAGFLEFRHLCHQDAQEDGVPLKLCLRLIHAGNQRAQAGDDVVDRLTAESKILN